MADVSHLEVGDNMCSASPTFNNDTNNHIDRRNSRFFTISSLPCELSPASMLKGPGTTVCKSRTTHRALITCNMSCAMWYKGAAQLLGLTELKSHLF